MQNNSLSGKTMSSACGIIRKSRFLRVQRVNPLGSLDGKDNLSSYSGSSSITIQFGSSERVGQKSNSNEGKC